MDGVDAAAKALDRGEQALGFVVHALAFGGDRETRAATSAQDQAQPGLQVLDVAADSGDADVELEFGGRQAAAVDKALEHL